jgi:hypothetical protein
LVWIFSALEPCTTYQPWHDKNSGRTYLRYDDGTCLLTDDALIKKQCVTCEQRDRILLLSEF